MRYQVEVMIRHKHPPIRWQWDYVFIHAPRDADAMRKARNALRTFRRRIQREIQIGTRKEDHNIVLTLSRVVRLRGRLATHIYDQSHKFGVLPKNNQPQ